MLSLRVVARKGCGAGAAGQPGCKEEKGTLVITIDGPAAAGKSTVARMLACRLGFDYLDTGAMYRAATWKALQSGIDLDDPQKIAEVAAAARIEFVGHGEQRRVICDGEDVTEQIRTPQVTENVFRVADEPAARQALIAQQRRIAEKNDLVTEGRDQGSEVFPDATAKFYLDASLQQRARRRWKDLRAAGNKISLPQVRQQMACRDSQDNARPMGALRRTEDMILIDSTNLSAEQVVERMLHILKQRRTDTACAHRSRCGKKADG